MKRIIIPALCLLTACSTEQDAGMVQPASEGYQRIISMDYCADQYVLALAEREDILALSPDADKKFSYLRDQADGIPQIRPVAESVLAAQPDLIVRSYGGGPLAPRFFSQAGIDVLQIGWTSDFESIRTVTRDIAAQMGVPERGEELIAAFDARLAAVTPRDDDQNVLYVTPGGVTSGPNGLINDAFETAGLTNYETRAGWHDLPLEQIATDAPDVLAVAFYDSIHQNPSIWSPSHHPVTLNALETAETVPLDASWTSCGAWYLIDAIEALAASGSEAS